MLCKGLHPIGDIEFISLLMLNNPCLKKKTEELKRNQVPNLNIFMFAIEAINYIVF